MVSHVGSLSLLERVLKPKKQRLSKQLLPVLPARNVISWILMDVIVCGESVSELNRNYI